MRLFYNGEAALILWLYL